MKVYVINLLRNIGRFEAQLPHLKKGGLEVIRVEGSSPTSEDLSAHPLLPRGAFGCRRAHMQLMQTILASGDPLAIVLEDDAYPRYADVAQRIRDAVRHYEPFDILSLHVDGYCGIQLPFVGDGLFCGSTAAYAVTREGAGAILDRVPVVLGHLDMDYNIAALRGRLNKKRVADNLFETDESSSDIAAVSKKTSALAHVVTCVAPHPKRGEKSPCHMFRSPLLHGLSNGEALGITVSLLFLLVASLVVDSSVFRMLCMTILVLNLPILPPPPC